MGRPTKKEQMMKAFEEAGFSLEDLASLIEPKIVEKEVIKEVIVEKETEKESVVIEDNLKIEIKANRRGATVLKTKGTNLFKKLQKRGAKARIKFEDLDAIMGEKPQLLTKGVISIVRPVSKDVSLEDIIEELGLEDIYFNEDKISTNYIESVLSDKVDASKFSSLLYSSEDMAKTLLDSAIDLHSQGKFNDGTKISVLRQAFAKPELFR